MIYVEGAAVCEVYYGDRAIGEIYLGDRLVWSATVPERCTASLVFALAADVSHINAGALSARSGASALPVSAVTPHLRITAPGEQRAAAAGMTAVQAAQTPSEGERASAYVSAASEVCLLAAEGETVKPAHLAGAVGAVNLIPAEGKTPRTRHMGVFPHAVHVIAGDGNTLRSAHMAGAVGEVPIVPAAGEPSCARHTAGSVSKAKPIAAESELHRTVGDAAGAVCIKPGLSGIQPQETKPISAPWGKASAAYAGAERTENNGSTLASAMSAATGGAGTVRRTALPGMIAPVSDLTAETAAAAESETAHACFGLCRMSMRTEQYEATSDYDTMLISAMDGLTVSGIDAMTIRI